MEELKLELRFSDSKIKFGTAELYCRVCYRKVKQLKKNQTAKYLQFRKDKQTTVMLSDDRH